MQLIQGRNIYRAEHLGEKSKETRVYDTQQAHCKEQIASLEGTANQKVVSKLYGTFCVRTQIAFASHMGCFGCAHKMPFLRSMEYFLCPPKMHLPFVYRVSHAGTKGCFQAVWYIWCSSLKCACRLYMVLLELTQNGVFRLYDTF